MNGRRAKDVPRILLRLLVDAIALRAKTGPTWNREDGKSPVFRHAAMPDGNVRCGWICE
jgi:hypothetical protein